MKILVINPNTTTSMTDKIRETARAVAAPGTEIVAINPLDGPVSIKGHYDEAYCLPGLLAGTDERDRCTGNRRRRGSREILRSLGRAWPEDMQTPRLRKPEAETLWRSLRCPRPKS